MQYNMPPKSVQQFVSHFWKDNSTYSMCTLKECIFCYFGVECSAAPPSSVKERLQIQPGLVSHHQKCLWWWQASQGPLTAAEEAPSLSEVGLVAQPQKASSCVQVGWGEISGSHQSDPRDSPSQCRFIFGHLVGGLNTGMMVPTCRKFRRRAQYRDNESWPSSPPLKPHNSVFSVCLWCLTQMSLMPTILPPEPTSEWVYGQAL